MDAEESTTAKLIEALQEDVDRCFELVKQQLDVATRIEGGIEADYEFAARQLVRAVFAFFEGMTFSLKMKGLQSCVENGLQVSEADRLMCAETRYELNEKGEIVERTAMLPLSKNLRFALSIYERGTHQRQCFDPSAQWWSSFQKSVLVRNRLTHPRMPDDLDVTPDELIAAMGAHVGFVALLAKYGESPADD